MTSYKYSVRNSLQNSDPGKILNLVKSLDDECCAKMQTHINVYLEDECDAELVLLVNVHSDRMEAFIEAVGKKDMTRKFKLKVTECMAEVLKSGLESVKYVSDMPHEFLTIFSEFLVDDGKRKRILMQPVIDKPFTTIVCVIGYKLLDETVSAIIHECFFFSWPALRKALSLDYVTSSKQKCQQLLKISRRLFSQVASLETLMQIAVEQIKELARAYFCVMFLLDLDKRELVDSWTKTNDGSLVERRFPMNLGITGEVLKQGTPINLKDAKSHPSFNPDIDGYPDRETRQLLLFPIRDQSGIIGVGQLVNKIRDPFFDSMDEEVCLAFSVHCGVSIVQAVVHRKMQETHMRSALANELVLYHIKVTDSEVSKVLNCKGHHQHPDLKSLEFNPRTLALRELPCFVITMFQDLGLDERFMIKPEKLACFILYTKKGYRDVPYHNWTHAFSVAQWAYAAISNLKLIEYGLMTDLQALMYLVACLVHDLDHRGTTNSFRMGGQTSLSALYTSDGSVMERHHLSQALSILNTPGCDILSTLTKREYDRALMMLKDFIMVTDLANYYKNLDEYQAIAKDFRQGNKHHQSALHSLLMVAADLSDQVKDWGCVKKTAAAVLMEFFNLGDESRGDLPEMIIDKDKCSIPDLEIQYLSTTCLTVFDTLAIILPWFWSCSAIIKGHIDRWVASKPVFAEVAVTSGLSVLLSPELDNLIDANLKEMERLRLEEQQREEEERKLAEEK